MKKPKKPAVREFEPDSLQQRRYAELFGAPPPPPPPKLKLKEIFNREHTGARRADAVQATIERLARSLWGRKPSFKGNSRGTATEIRCDVRAALDAEIAIDPSRVPDEWSVANSGDDKEALAREIDRIARRVGRLIASDKRRSSD